LINVSAALKPICGIIPPDKRKIKGKKMKVDENGIERLFSQDSDYLNNIYPSQ
jgi:hypothetical protein